MGIATTFAALAPIFLIIALGHLLRRHGFAPDALWAAAERLVYWVLFPALLLVTTAEAELAGLRIAPVALAIVSALALMGLAVLPLRHWLRLTDPAFTSVFQAAIRMNVYVGLAAAQALWGRAGLTLSGLVVAVMVPTANLLSVLVLARYGTRPARGLRLVLAVVSNPLIVACLAGFALNLSGRQVWPVALETLRILGQGSLPLALLCVGAGLELRGLGELRRPVLVGSLVKLVATPAAAALTLWLFGVEGLTARVALLFHALPVSASSYVLARQMGGDATLLAALITVTTIAAALTLPVVLALAGHGGA